MRRWKREIIGLLGKGIANDALFFAVWQVTFSFCSSQTNKQQWSLKDIPNNCKFYPQNIFHSSLCPLWSWHKFKWFSDACSRPYFSCKLLFMCTLWIAIVSWRYCRHTRRSSVLLRALWNWTAIVSAITKKIVSKAS